jgi:CPA2 family monovalent cation:H+ antiporter-2
MTHDISLITTIAAALGLALLCGLGAAYLKLPPLLGYLVAGMIVGPATPGFVADIHLAGQLAEIGVMLLMFGVGLHFSIGDLWAVRKIAIPGAIIQIAAATAMGAGLGMFWGWSVGPDWSLVLPFPWPAPSSCSGLWKTREYWNLWMATLRWVGSWWRIWLPLWS